MALKLEALTAQRKQYKQKYHQLQQLVDDMHHKLENKEMEVTSLQHQVTQLTGAITEQVDSHFSVGRQEKLTSVYSDKGNKMAENSKQATHPDVLVPLSYDQNELASSESNLSTHITHFRNCRSSPDNEEARNTSPF